MSPGFIWVGEGSCNSNVPVLCEYLVTWYCEIVALPSRMCVLKAENLNNPVAVTCRLDLPHLKSRQAALYGGSASVIEEALFLL